MDGDLRIDKLARRVSRLETRVHTLERQLEAEGSLAEERSFAPAAPPAPPPLPTAARHVEPERPAPMPQPARWPLPAARTPLPAAAAATPPTPLPPAPTPSVPARAPLAPGGPDPLWTPSVPSAASAAARTEPRRPSTDLRDLEERFAGRALAWIGGFALMAAAVFFLSLAFSRGWINEPMRVVIGLVAGCVALGAGVLSFDRRNPLVGNVLTAVGLGIVSIALFAATRAYGLVPPELGLLGALLAAIAAAAIAIRYDAREVAVFGLIAALIAPPLMGASPTTLTLLFVAVTLVGTTAIALFRSWRWLPSIAFVLAAPQLAGWIVGGADTVWAMIALAGFWLVNVVAAGGEEVRIRRDDLRPSSATLVLANAAFLTWGGYAVLTGDAHAWLGSFIAVAAAAHLSVGGAFLYRQGLRHLFGNLVAGTGVALLALASFVQLGAALVPVAWAAEAAALAWLAARRTHVWSALAARALGTLAVAHLVLVEYPLDQVVSVVAPSFGSAWLHPEAASLAAVLGALAVAAWFAPVAWVRSVLVAVAAAVAGYAATFEVAGPALATTWVIVAVSAMLLDVAVQRAGTRADLARFGGLVMAGSGTAAAGVFGVLAAAHVVIVEYPLTGASLRAASVFAAPWVHEAVVPVLALLIAVAVVAWAWPARLVRSIGVAAAALLVGYVLTFEAGGALLILLLGIVALAATELDPVVARRGTRADLALLDRLVPFSWLGTAAGAWLWLTAIAALVAVEYAPARLGDAVGSVPYAGEPALSLAVVLVGSALVGARVGTRSIRSAMAGIGVLLVAWSVPFELDGTARIAMLAVLLPLAVVGDRFIALLPAAKRFAFLAGPREAGGLCSGAGAVSWFAALAVAAVSPLHPAGWWRVTPPAIPFTDEPALVAVVLAGAAVAAAAWAVTVDARHVALLGAIVPVALAAPLEVHADGVVVLWLLLAAAAMAVTRSSDLLRPLSYGLGSVLGAGALVVAFAIVAPPYRLWVDAEGPARPPLLAGWWVALATVAAVPYLASRRVRAIASRPVLEVGAAALGVYLVSVGVVDVFGRMVGGSITTEELAKQAQVALSVAWTAVGALALGFGLRARRAMPRHIGFGLLALATAKVFAVDLAAMDVAYRAVVLAGLGVLLLVSAWLFTHLHGPRPGTPGVHGPWPAG